MSEPENTADVTQPKRSKLPLLLGLLLALIGGGAGFYATWSGMILGGESAQVEVNEMVSEDVYFVEVEPLVISLSGETTSRHLRFRANLEVPSSHKDEVKKLLPRVVDVLNSYLRALEPGDFEKRAALPTLRAQMLRRVQVVVGRERVRDLLVMEFVLN